jgi:hypothetical protein
MPLSRKQWDNLTFLDEEAFDHDEDVISTRIDKQRGIWDADYNGHFGRQIEFTAETHAQAEKTCLFIEAILG